ncbi:MAG TPA: hypothetical protein VFO62_06415, partial [Candidatus Binatia bacterium]|nr:hypothetical protein [Candidatus Binatia bacterium]
MANPKALGGFLRRLMTPAGVMIVTTALVFLSLSDHRVDNGIDASARSAATVASASAAAVETAAPVAVATMILDSAGARPRDRLVVAAIRPERGLV